MLAKTGLTVAVHQVQTVTNYLELRSRAPDLPFVPVLQGWSRDDYHRCVELYDRADINLAAEPLVGVNLPAAGDRRDRGDRSFPRVYRASPSRLRGRGRRPRALRGLPRRRIRWPGASRHDGRHCCPVAVTPTARTAYGMRRRGGSARSLGLTLCRCTCGWLCRGRKGARPRRCRRRRPGRAGQACGRRPPIRGRTLGRHPQWAEVAAVQVAPVNCAAAAAGRSG